MLIAEDGCLCVEKVATDLKNPTWGTFVKDDQERFFVLEQKGYIWVYSKEWTRSSQPFLDLTDRVYVTTRLADERGLLGSHLFSESFILDALAIAILKFISLEYMSCSKYT